jgi:hypothetical protein
VTFSSSPVPIATPVASAETNGAGRALVFESDFAHVGGAFDAKICPRSRALQNGHWDEDGGLE